MKTTPKTAQHTAGRRARAIQVGKARSILPNSSPEILQPIKSAHGSLQVVWLEAIDAHGLFFQHDRDGSASLLATHHNGFSCHTLAVRIAAGERERVEDQVEYIRRCGGTATIIDGL